MASGRFDIEKFSERNDFALWKVKMMAILTQQGLDDSLMEDQGEAFKEETKENEIKLQNKAKSVIFLSLDDKVL